MTISRSRIKRLERQLATSAGRPDDCDFNGGVLWGDESAIGPASLAWDHETGRPFGWLDEGEAGEQ